MARKRLLSPPPPKPCPRCYNAMKLGPDGYACEKHGKPTPDRPVVAAASPRPPKKVAAQPRPKRVRKSRAPARKVWTRPSGPRYPSDLKAYPLPPSPDGRAHARTSTSSPTTARSRLTPDLFAEAVKKHEAGLTPWQIAADMWKRAGYSSREACKGSLYRAFRAAGVLAKKGQTEQ